MRNGTFRQRSLRVQALLGTPRSGQTRASQLGSLGVCWWTMNMEGREVVGRVGPVPAAGLAPSQGPDGSTK